MGKNFVTSGWTRSQGASHLTHFFLSVNGTRIDANFMVSIANFDQCVLFFKWSHSTKVVIIQVANVYLQRHQRSRVVHYVSKRTGWVGSEKFQFLLNFGTVFMLT